MTEREIYMKLFNISINTYYNWKKEERPIIKLLSKYITNTMLIEFLETNEIESLNNNEFINDIIISKYDDFVGKVLDEEDEHYWDFKPDEKMNYINQLFLSRPILILFDYIITKHELDEHNYRYSRDMIDTIFKYKENTNEVLVDYKYILNLDKEISEIFYFLNNCNGFNYYHNGRSINIKRHKYYYNLYFELKAIDNELNLSQQIKNELAYDLISSD